MASVSNKVTTKDNGFNHIHRFKICTDGKNKNAPSGLLYIVRNIHGVNPG